MNPDNRFLTQEELDELEFKGNISRLDKLNYIVERTEERIRNNIGRGRYHATRQNWVFFLNGPKPITDEEDIKNLSRMFCTSINRDIRFAEIGTPEENGKGGYHQHCLIICDKAYTFQKKPIFKSKDGTIYTINFFDKETNAYTARKKDWSYYLKYIRKNEENKPYMQWNVNYFTPEGNVKDSEQKRSYDGDLLAASEMQTMGEAIEYMRTNHPSRFLTHEGAFRQLWLSKNHDRLQREKIDEAAEILIPFDEERTEIKMIRNFIGRVLKYPNRRHGNLFIIGPSKMGKTEFINQNVIRKIPTYWMKGNFDWTGYDEAKNYKIMVFDDVKYFNVNVIEQIKALTSSVNQPVNVNIKYGGRTVISKPIIHLTNKEEFGKFKAAIKRSNQQAWWDENMTEVFINKPLFDVERAKEFEEQYYHGIPDDYDDIETLPSEGEEMEEREEMNKELDDIAQKNMDNAVTKFFELQTKETNDGKFSHNEEVYNEEAAEVFPFERDEDGNIILRTDKDAELVYRAFYAQIYNVTYEELIQYIQKNYLQNPNHITPERPPLKSTDIYDDLEEERQRRLNTDLSQFSAANFYEKFYKEHPEKRTEETVTKSGVFGIKPVNTLDRYLRRKNEVDELDLPPTPRERSRSISRPTTPK